MKKRILTAGIIFALAMFAAESGAELFQKAVTAERAAGNLEEAIKLYNRVATEFASDRGLAAKALVAEARCYERLGKDKQGQAVKLYEQVANDFADQRDQATAARTKLAALRQSPPPPTMTLRKLDTLGALSVGEFISSFSDGQRAVYLDDKAHEVVFSDLTGKNKRVIFNSGPSRRVYVLQPTRDFSTIWLGLIDSGGVRTRGVVRSDGSGFHEVYKGPASGCSGDFSWDDRDAVLCEAQPDGSFRLFIVSMVDGRVRDVLRGPRMYNPRFSPDGRFIAYYNTAGIFIVPSQGGEPQLVSKSGGLMDWTRDGRYLNILNSRAGTIALFLLPVRGGKAAGEPVFVRYGGFGGGFTTSAGALVYWSGSPDASRTMYVAEFNESGHLGAWTKSALIENGTASYVVLSPDGSQLSYNTRNSATGQVDFSLHVRNLSSGEDRELSQNSFANCVWANLRPNLICQHRASNVVEFASVAIDSGRAERIGPVGDPRTIYGVTKDDRLLYLTSQSALSRWDIETQRETILEPITERFFNVIPSPGNRWLLRLANTVNIEVRPASGGSWKQIASVRLRSPNVSEIAFAPDGESVMYVDQDPSSKPGLFRIPTAGGTPERLADLPPSAEVRQILAGGRKVVMVSSEGSSETWILENYVPKAAQ